MFLITGINGKTGSAAAGALLAAGHGVRALVRDEGPAAAWRDRGVELVTSDVTDADSIARAMDGVDGVYAMVPPDMGHPDPLALYR